MSGLCGWFGASAADPEGALRRMAAALPAHGPCRQDLSTGPGWALACRARTGMGGGHVGDEVWAVIEGRPRWHDPEGRALSARLGDAAALAACWRRHGEGLCDAIGGTFGFALVDIRRGIALCAIDRMGVHGLCWAQAAGGGVVFGSTTDAVRCHPAMTATVAPQAIHDFLYFVDRIPAPATIYREQRKLMPGELLVIQNGRAEVKPYWRIAYGQDEIADPQDAAAELRARLQGAVARSLDGVPAAQMGAFLSGGLDSSTIAGLAAQLCPERLDAFTIGFDDSRFDESRFARIAADHFRLRHHQFTLGADQVTQTIQIVATLFDEPFANSSAIPTFFCAQAASNAGMAVLLAGDGGDELFAGNERYLKDRVFQLYNHLPEALKRLSLRLPPDLPLRKVANYLRLARLPMAVRVTRDNLFAKLSADDVLHPDILGEIDFEAPARHVEALFDQLPAASDLQRFLYLDHRLTLADGDLRKVGRACELAGIEVRYPMLDDEVVALSARIASALLCRNGRLRAFYKEAWANFLPRAILDKPKHGFGLPYEQFLANHPPLRDLAKAGLEGLKAHGWFRPRFLDQVSAQLKAGGTPDGVAWDLVTLAQWLESRMGPARRAAAE